MFCNTATTPNDYSAVPVSVTFEAGSGSGESSLCIVIQIIDDADFEGDETLIVVLAIFGGFPIGQTIVTIEDNDG